MKQASKIILLIFFISSNLISAINEGSWFKKGITFSTFHKDQIVNCHYYAAGNTNIRALDISFLYYNPTTYEKTTTIRVPIFKLLGALNIPSEDFEVTKKELNNILPKGKFISNNELIFFIKKNIYKLTLKENKEPAIELIHKSVNTIYDVYAHNNTIYSIHNKGVHKILNNKATSILKWQKQNWTPTNFNVDINKNNQQGVLTLGGTDKGETVFKSIIFNLTKKRIVKTYEHQNSIALLNNDLLLAYANGTNNLKIENYITATTVSENTTKDGKFTSILKTVICGDRFIALETADKTFVIDIVSGELKKTIDFSNEVAAKGHNENLLTGFKNQKMYFATKNISLASLFDIQIDNEAPKLFVNNLTKNSENLTTDSFTTIEGVFMDDSNIKAVTINNEKVKFNAKDGRFSHTATLEKGINQFIISGTDLLNNTTTTTYSINREEPIVASRGQNYGEEKTVEKKITDFTYKALLISNQKYTNGIDSLEFPIEDASNLAAVLRKKYSFEEKNIVHLKDATRADIINTLDSLASKITSKDNLLIFYAGHGVYDEVLNKGYWIPVNASYDKDNWVSNSDIKDYISAFKSQHTLLISDACFSGSIFEYNQRNLNPRGQIITEKLINKKSRKAMTSGLNKTVPDKSIFIEYLIKTLKNNKKSYLRAGELYNDIREAVIANTDNNPQFEVIKNAHHEGGEFIF